MVSEIRWTAVINVSVFRKSQQSKTIIGPLTAYLPLKMRLSSGLIFTTTNKLNWIKAQS